MPLLANVAEGTCGSRCRVRGGEIGLQLPVPAQLSEVSRRSASTAWPWGAELRCAALPCPALTVVVSELKRAAGWAALPFEADLSSKG